MPAVAVVPSQPVDPKIASRKIAHRVSRFLQAVRTTAPDHPSSAPARLLIKATQGSGKTYETMRAVVDLWSPGTSVHFLSPTSSKAEETARDLAKLAGERGRALPVQVVRGRSALNPAGPVPAKLMARCTSRISTPDRMCLRSQLAKRVAEYGADVGGTLCRAGCPFASECPYLGQFDPAAKERGGVWCMTHASGLVRTMAPDPHVVIVDEDIVRSLPRRTGIPLGVIAHVASELPADPGRTLQAIVDALAGQRGTELAALRRSSKRNSALDDEALRACREAIDAAVERTKCPLDPHVDDHLLLEKLERPQGAIDHWRIRQLLDQVRLELPCKRDGLNSVVREDRCRVEGRWEELPYVSIAWLGRLARTDDVPVLLLDGTANVDLARRAFGTTLEVEEIRVRRRERLVQVVGRTFSKTSLAGYRGRDGASVGTEAAAALRSSVTRFLSTLPGHVFLALPKKLLPLMTEEGLPAHVQLGQLNLLRGMNTWERCQSAVLLSRELPTPSHLEWQARAFAAADDTFFALQEHVRCRRTIRTRKGGRADVDVWVNPDPRVGALLQQARDAELDQARDRVRSVRHDRTVYLLADVVLEPVVDEIVVWQSLTARLDGIDPILSRLGILPLNAEHLHRLAPERFSSANAVAKEWAKLRKHAGHTSADSLLETLFGDRHRSGGLVVADYRIVKKNRKCSMYSQVIFDHLRVPAPAQHLADVLRAAGILGPDDTIELRPSAVASRTSARRRVHTTAMGGRDATFTRMAM